MMVVEDKESGGVHLVRAGIVYMSAKIDINNCVINFVMSCICLNGNFLPFETALFSVFYAGLLTVIM
jgi:hypothetical protein